MKIKFIAIGMTFVVLALAGYFGYRARSSEQWTFVHNGGLQHSLPSLNECIKFADAFFENKEKYSYSCRKNCKKYDTDDCELVMVCNLPNGCALEKSQEVENYKAFVNYEKENAQDRIKRESEQFQYVSENGSDDSIFKNESKIGGKYSNYSTDGKAVYYEKGKSIESPRAGKVMLKMVDQKTFTVIDDAWAKDNSHVYYAGLIMDQLDPGTVQIIKNGEYGGAFIKDKFAVYRVNIQPDMSRWILKLDGADSKSFVQLGDFHGKDEKHVYYINELIKGADPKTFKP